MKVSMYCAGIGPSATGDFIRRSAQAAERAGFSAFWVPEHTVLFATYPESQYPYGEKPLDGANVSIPDPIVAMTWAAAATEKIEIGTGVVILPQHNPLVFAKGLATLDAFSGGRVVLGAGVGWAKEEYAAVGIPWANRGKRMGECIAAMRVLWRNEVSTFQGETVSFKDVYMNPKPVRKDIPILLGGESDAALARVARAADGWFPAGLSIADAPTRIAYLKKLTRAQGRDPEALRLLAPIYNTTTLDDLKRWREAGITEFYLIETLKMPIEDAPMTARMTEMRERFVDTVAGW